VPPPVTATANRFPDGVWDIAGFLQTDRSMEPLLVGRLAVRGDSSRISTRYGPDCRPGRRTESGTVVHECGSLTLFLEPGTPPTGWLQWQEPSRYTQACNAVVVSEGSSRSSVTCLVPTVLRGTLRLRRTRP